ncbi:MULTISPECIES: HNH endonuclease signature motif containing protein [Micrococcaceae]|uniref:HNH endonuclease signature motif containing protein n=1 Tax=Micrococcaceae TaxID=1268 RepID=UPI00351A8258
MENGAGTGTGVEAIHATVAALAALDAEDAALASAGASGTAGDGVDVLQRAYEIRLERMGLEKKLESQASARKVRSAAEAMDLQRAMTPPDAPLHDRTYTEISTVEEIAGILTISSGAASAFVTQSRQVCAMPPLMDALSAGSLSWQQARIFADETECLDHAAAGALVEHFLDPDAPNPARGCPASELVPARLRAKVRGWRERHHPESIEKRHRKGVADRRVEFTPDRDGMAWIAAYLPADQALAIWNDLTATARSLQGPDEPRTLTQLRPDILTHRLLTYRSAITPGPTGTGDVSGEAPEDMIGLATVVGSDEPATDLGISDHPGSHGNRAPAEPDPTAPGTFESTPNPALDTDAAKVPTPRADVLVTVPFFALLGLTDEPAALDGYGPIPASMARQLLSGGAESFRRVLLDPSDGTPLEIGRTSYRLTKAMRKALHLRDGKCAFPGCSNNALDNEIDHLKAWQHGGTTGISNLAQVCPKHHRLKHNSGWEPTPAAKDEPPGWTSPTGQQYHAEQPDREPPQWPPDILPLENSAPETSPTKSCGSKISASETSPAHTSALEGLLLQLLSG